MCGLCEYAFPPLPSDTNNALSQINTSNPLPHRAVGDIFVAPMFWVAVGFYLLFIPNVSRTVEGLFVPQVQPLVFSVLFDKESDDLCRKAAFE